MLIGYESVDNAMGAYEFTGDNSYSASVAYIGTPTYIQDNDIWFKLAYDGTNCYVYYSNDGANWVLAKEYTSTATWGFLANAATHYGFGYDTNDNGAGAEQDLQLISWTETALP